MRRRGPEYTFEPYDRVPDGERVPQPRLTGWRQRVGQLVFIACLILVPLLIVMGSAK